MQKKNVTDSICEKVTAKLVAMIEAGVTPWRKPWTGGESVAAVSHTTGKEYSLLNQILLDFRGGEYLTFNQVKAEGGMVKKGAKAKFIVFWQAGQLKAVDPVEIDDTDGDAAGEGDGDGVWVKWTRPVLKYYNVFHIDDCEGIERKHTKAPEAVEPYDFERDTQAEDVAAGYVEREGIKLHIKNCDKAYYRPADDSVTVPEREQYACPAEFYSILYHELTHSTGHRSRLNRFGENAGIAARDEKEYSREELIAEIGAATCLARLGINCDDSDANSAAYLEHWATFLKEDPRAFVVAAGKAEKAVNLIFG